MFLFYVDESGTCSNDNQTNYFVLAAIAVEDQHSLQIYKEFSVCKQRIFLKKNPEEWELKTRELCQGEKLFKGHKWESRVRIFLELSNTLAQLPLQIFAVVVNKELYYMNREELKNDVLLYRLTFNRLLEELDAFLKHSYTKGILLMDSRSTHSTSVQDGRLVKAYRDWVKSKDYESGFIEQPWFGVSQFCIGLQIADYFAYLLSLRLQHIEGNAHKAQLLEAFKILQPKIQLVEIPEIKESIL